MIHADPDAVIAAARRWLGTPYHDQASLCGVGCDCLGLARGVWRDLVGAEPQPIPPYSRDWGETGVREVLADGARAMMIEVPLWQICPGTLALFRMAPRAIAKHVGILTDPDRFIHSCERLGDGGSPSPSCSRAPAATENFNMATLVLGAVGSAWPWPAC